MGTAHIMGGAMVMPPWRHSWPWPFPLILYCILPLPPSYMVRVEGAEPALKGCLPINSHPLPPWQLLGNILPQPTPFCMTTTNLTAPIGGILLWFPLDITVGEIFAKSGPPPQGYSWASWTCSWPWSSPILQLAAAAPWRINHASTPPGCPFFWSKGTHIGWSANERKWILPKERRQHQFREVAGIVDNKCSAMGTPQHSVR